MRLIASLLFALALALATPVAAAGCFGAGTPMFHCTAKNGTKAIDICLQGEVAIYRFGPLGGVAELLLARHVDGVHMRPWNGVGSSIFEEVTFYNGTYEYLIHYAVDRIAATTPQVTGGIRVQEGDHIKAELGCDTGSVAARDFYPLFEAKEASGQCWSHDSFTWGPC